MSKTSLKDTDVLNLVRLATLQSHTLGARIIDTVMSIQEEKIRALEERIHFFEKLVTSSDPDAVVRKNKGIVELLRVPIKEDKDVDAS